MQSAQPIIAASKEVLDTLIPQLKNAQHSAIEYAVDGDHRLTCMRITHISTDDGPRLQVASVDHEGNESSHFQTSSYERLFEMVANRLDYWHRGPGRGNRLAEVGLESAEPHTWVAIAPD